MRHIGTQTLTTDRLTLRRLEIEDETCYQWDIGLNDMEQIIGKITVEKIEDEIGQVDISYHIDEKFRHWGYTSEAVTEMVRFFFDEIDASRVCIVKNAEEENYEEEPEVINTTVTKVVAEDGTTRNVISDETMEYVGILAKLELSPEEAEAAKKDMGEMLDYIDQLNELDTTGIEPMSHVFPVQNVFREDIVTNGDGSVATLANAPLKKDGGFKVPKTIGE